MAVKQCTDCKQCPDCDPKLMVDPHCETCSWFVPDCGTVLCQECEPDDAWDGYDVAEARYLNRGDA